MTPAAAAAAAAVDGVLPLVLTVAVADVAAIEDYSQLQVAADASCGPKQNWAAELTTPFSARHSVAPLCHSNTTCKIVFGFRFFCGFNLFKLP